MTTRIDLRSPLGSKALAGAAQADRPDVLRALLAAGAPLPPQESRLWNTIWSSAEVNAINAAGKYISS
ncbi:MAG: hypothetical protein ACI8W8_000637 [Rhodothermales bacterium]